MSAKKKGGELVPVNVRAITALGMQERDKELIALAASTSDITAITNADGYKQVRGARIVLKNLRVEIQNAGKKAREDAQAFSKAVIAEEKRLVGLISPEETRLETLEVEEDNRLEAIRQAEIEAELKRVAEIDARIETIRGWPVHYAGKPSALIRQAVETANNYVIDEQFAEKSDLAQNVLDASRAALSGILSQREAHEAEQERIKKEREELARLRAEAAERETKERARIAEEERQAKIARDAEAARQAEQFRAQREQEEKERRERQRIIDEENERRRVVQEAQAKAERDRIAAEEAALEERLAAERAKSARIEAERAEAARIERERIAAEEARLAAERAELTRQQEEFRRTQAPVHLASARTETTRPSASAIVDVLANEYETDIHVVLGWIRDIDWNDEAIAA
jgi:hypothetical protein